MYAKWILSVLSAVFLCLAAVRLWRHGGRLAPATRAWLLVGIMFAAVSLWLWHTG
jgi:hypothetical protein